MSRKVTKFVSKKDIRNKEPIQESALNFLIDTMPLLEEFGKENVVNADQSGFELELHAGRTLDFKGVKKVEVIAQSKNALTHSYTIMPTMTAAGKLIEPMYMVLRETNGNNICFGAKSHYFRITFIMTAISISNYTFQVCLVRLCLKPCLGPPILFLLHPPPVRWERLILISTCR